MTVVAIAMALVGGSLWAIRLVLEVRRTIKELRRQRAVLEAIVSLLLDGYDPDLEQDAWIKILWYPSGDPPEREGGRMTADERGVIERLMPKPRTGRREHG